MSAAPNRGSGCSTRPAPTRSRNSTRVVSVSGSRAVTPSTTATCSSALNGKCRRGLAGEWLVDYAGERDNLRAALDWAFSPSGGESIGMALTVAAIPLWLQLPMIDECRRRVEQVFASPARGTPIDARGEMKLQAALGASLMFAKGAIPAVSAGLYRGSPPRRIARRHRIPVESVVGALGSPHEHGRARRRPRRGPKILHPRAGTCRPGHPADRGSDDGRCRIITWAIKRTLGDTSSGC